MMTKLFFLVSITLQLISFSSQSENQKPPTAVQAELTNYGFPIGLLPASVKKSSLSTRPLANSPLILVARVRSRSLLTTT
ncbi:hypothetical protein OIU78_003526 [Salix suchowensis]|nr:hypothetical protein OIU78_003526 [Salix suchowensis]